MSRFSGRARLQRFCKPHVEASKNPYLFVSPDKAIVAINLAYDGRLRPEGYNVFHILRERGKIQLIRGVKHIVNIGPFQTRVEHDREIVLICFVIGQVNVAVIQAIIGGRMGIDGDEGRASMSIKN